MTASQDKLPADTQPVGFLSTFAQDLSDEVAEDAAHAAAKEARVLSKCSKVFLWKALRYSLITNVWTCFLLLVALLTVVA